MLRGQRKNKLQIFNEETEKILNLNVLGSGVQHS